MFVNIFNDLFGIRSFSFLLLIVAEGYDGVYPSGTAWRSRGVRFCVVEGYGLFLVVFNLHKCGDGEGDEAEGHDYPEETLIANVFGDETRHHAGNHHTTEVLTCGTDGEDGGGVFASGEGDEIEGVGGKAKAVADLFDAHTGADEPEVVGGVITEININDVGQGDAEHQGPEAAFQSPFGHGPSAHDAAEEESDDAEGAVDEAEIHVAHGQTTLCRGTREEKGNYLGQESFGQTEQEDETDG